MNVEFHDFSVQVIEALDEATVAFLYEAATTLTSAAKDRSSPQKYGDIQANKLWSYVVDEDIKEAYVGASREAGFWEELGTGEFALNGDGRKGWWVYIEGDSTGDGGKSYSSKAEAEDAAAFLRKVKGLNAHVTNGRRPQRPLHKAFTAKKTAIIKRAEEVLKGME